MVPEDVVLVHGAWHTSWCWKRLEPLLSAQGFRVTAVDLPGRDDLETAAGTSAKDVFASVARTVEVIGKPVTLVGHSLGGAVISNVAELVPQQIHRLVYVSAFVPAPGQSVIDIASSVAFSTSMALRHKVDPTRGLTTFPREHAQEAFYAETDESASAEALDHLVPDGLMVMAHVMGADAGAAASARPRRYVEGLRDRAIPLDVQRLMCKVAGITDVVTLDSDHSPMLSMPAALAQAIREGM
ncbi:alpha/beta fold hydrolase [Streptomyces mirabilis]